MIHTHPLVVRLFSRRQVALMLGSAGLGLAMPGVPRVQAESGLCVVRPQQTDGPYYLNHRLNRSDIRSDSADGNPLPGMPLALRFSVYRKTGDSCEPLPKAVVDIWQCDSQGHYSGVAERRFDTRGRDFLRGFQVTDDAGLATFQTLYPGWYRGRAVHIHFKIRTEPDGGRGHTFTSQLYFDDGLTDRIHARAPYADKPGQRLRNDGDFIYHRGGERLQLSPIPEGEGLAAEFRLALEV